MNQEITYKASAKDLKEVFTEVIRKEVVAEQRARLNSKLIDVDTLAKIHGVHPDTIYNYIKSGDIATEPRTANGKCMFRLGDAIDIDFQQLRKKLKNHNL